MKKIIEEQLRLHKNIGLQDIYKLIYQAEFGLHYYSDLQKTIRKEYSRACMGKGRVEKKQVLEKISKDYYRLDLKSYILELNNDTILMMAALESAKLSNGTKQGLIKRWEDFKKLNSEWELFSEKEIESFEKILKEKDSPEIHHSEEYKKENGPCYIVLHKKVIEFWYKEKWLY